MAGGGDFELYVLGGKAGGFALFGPKRGWCLGQEGCRYWKEINQTHYSVERSHEVLYVQLRSMKRGREGQRSSLI